MASTKQPQERVAQARSAGHLTHLATAIDTGTLPVQAETMDLRAIEPVPDKEFPGSAQDNSSVEEWPVHRQALTPCPLLRAGS